jgi:ergothioneine biosynthesis protein EgtB
MNKFELIEYFKRVRKVTEDICKPLETEDYVIQPVADVSPPKWHLGHTTWFYEAMFLDRYIPDYKPYHPAYGFLFNSYYQSFGERWERPRRGVLSRPTVKEVYQFRKHIDEKMITLINTMSEKDWPEFPDLLVLALNHEQQHQELLVTDIKYILGVNPLQPAYRESQKNEKITETTAKAIYLPYEGGIYPIGFQESSFCYDNELPVHERFVNHFQLRDRLVTNSEYLAFMEDGGYKDFRYWLSEGWDVVQREKWDSPLHWMKLDNHWYEMTMDGWRKLLPDSPVCHVSYYEAEAFASWTGKRLPTEDEWETAARLSQAGKNSANFWDEGILHPTAVISNSNGNPLQLMGDVWEWTSSAYLPYPGYRQAAGALGEYNGKFMVNQMVLRGGSCATSRDHARISYRNFFQPDKRWQFAGIRLADELK